MKQDKRIIIVGSGLSGLTIAYLLAQKNIETTILEGSSRIGGRIQTVKGALETPLELGATWFSELHTHLLALIEELEIIKYPQFSKGISIFQTKSFEPPQKFFVPESETPSYRIAGGTQMLIDSLSQRIPKKNIHPGTKVFAIKETGNELCAESIDGRKFYADKVIICIPPQLVASQIQFSPELPNHLFSLLPNVQTWMAGAIKFVLEYSEEFWRNDNYSGMLYSHSGIITEMYDHTNFEENKYGFTGFLNSNAATYPEELRKEFVLNQLKALFGEKIPKPAAYFDKVWTNEFISPGHQINLRPHQNNGHPLLQESYLNGKLFFSGTETSSEFSGYMEGAIISAKRTVDQILGY